MMTSLGTFAEKQGGIFLRLLKHPPLSEWCHGPEVRTEGKVLLGFPTSCSFNCSKWAHTQPWVLARLLPATITTPMKICEWPEWRALALPPLFHLIFPCPHCSLPLLVSSNCPHLHYEKKAPWFKMPFTSGKPFSFLQAEWGNQWMNQAFTVGNFVGASAAPGWCRPEPLRAQRQDGKESRCYKPDAETTSIRLSPATFACEQVLHLHFTN